jgi:serine protease Do
MSIKSRWLAGTVAATAMAAFAAGGLSWSLAHAAPNSLGPVALTNASPPSFADLIQHVAPAVVSIDVTLTPAAENVALQEDEGAPDEGQDSGGPEVGGRSSGGVSPFQFFFGAPGAQGQGQGNPFAGIPGFPGFGQGGGAPLKEQATASGFFISPDGYIVTNNHVVQGATSITVRLADQRQFKARLIGRDPATDLAVIKIDGTGFTYVNFEDKAQPRVGDWVVAVGNPYDLGGTATAGIVSALARPNVSQSSFVDYMQIDAPINRGNSGGPTFDVYGRVVGVNAAIYSPSGGSVGIGFAIPADVAESVTRQLIAHGHVSRGYIGAEIQGITPDIAASLGIRPGEGALVAQLTPGGPAERGGLKVGDVIVGVDGQPVHTASALTQRVAMVGAGQALQLQILRDGHPTTIALRAALRPSEAQLASADLGAAGGGDGAAAEESARILGMRLTPLDPQTRQRYGLADSTSGVLVQGVGADSDAAAKGLHPGDVIVRAGDRRVTSSADVASAVADARRTGRHDVLLLVSRNGRTVFIPVGVQSARG